MLNKQFMAYQHYQGPGMGGAPVSRDFLWQVFQRFDFCTVLSFPVLNYWFVGLYPLLVYFNTVAYLTIIVCC